MHIDAVLRKLGELERSLADLYGSWSELFAADEEAAFVFFKMTGEEKAHAGLVDYQRKLVQNSPALSVDVQFDLTEVEAVLARAKTLRKTTVPPTVAEALGEALRIERSAAESHCRNALKLASPGVARLLDALGAEDKLHVARLADLAARRGIEVAPA